jgi:hypothetical protein
MTSPQMKRKRFVGRTSGHLNDDDVLGETVELKVVCGIFCGFMLGIVILIYLSLFEALSFPKNWSTLKCK